MSGPYMFDAAYAPSLEACKNAGGIAMSHYLTGNYEGSSPQPDATRAAGMGAVFNYEQSINEEVGASRAAGQAIAQRAVAAVPAACPRDGTIGIYFSVDTSVAASNLSACDQAFLGIRDVARPQFQVKVYGEGALIDHLVAAGLVDGRQWLSESSAFPGFNVHDGNVVLLQNHDASGNWLETPVPGTDVNTILDPHALGAWWPDGSPYATVAHATPRKKVRMFIIGSPGQPHRFLVTGEFDGNGRLKAKPIAHRDEHDALVAAGVPDIGSVDPQSWSTYVVTMPTPGQAPGTPQ